MPLNEVTWGYCRHCNKEVEVRDGVLIVHDVTYNGGRCRGGGKAPTAPPREGGWTPPSEPPAATREPGIAEAIAAPQATMWSSFFRRVREG